MTRVPTKPKGVKPPPPPPPPNVRTRRGLGDQVKTLLGHLAEKQQAAGQLPRIDVDAPPPPVLPPASKVTNDVIAKKLDNLAAAVFELTRAQTALVATQAAATAELHAFRRAWEASDRDRMASEGRPHRVGAPR